jgi:endonuclease-3
MTSVSRTPIFAKIHKVLKKYYKPSAPPEDRPVLEHLLFACVLEDARYDQAEEAFAALKHTFFDWNEVRVTSISELSEVMAVLPDPRTAANRVKRVLHAVFEELYCFDLEDVRKKNLGPTVKWLEKMDGTSRFVVSYVVQAALGGHSIPVDAGTMSAFRVLDLASEKEAAAGEVPGMERAIAKSKGVEFGSLIHQLGADYSANPFSPQVREILLAIDPEAAQRFPQRRQPRPETPPLAGPAEAAPPPASSGRRKKPEAAAKPPAAETKPAEAKASEAKPSDGKQDESKKMPLAASKKAAEPHQEPTAAQKQPEKSQPAEPPARSEKPAKADKQAKVEKQEKRPADPPRGCPAPKALPAADALGKRKPR